MATAGNGSAPGGLQTANLGQVQISYKGAAKPAVLDFESGISVAALAGVALSSFQVTPASTLDNTTVAYLAGNNDVMTYARGVTQPALDLEGHGPSGCAFGHDGRLYYADVDTSGYVMDRSYYDGSGLSSLYAPASRLQDIAVSPNDTVMVGSFNAGGIFAVSTTGTGFLTLDSAGIEPSISPDGTTVVYDKPVSGKNQLFTVPIGGGTPTQLISDTSVNMHYPSYSPDGTVVLCDFDTGSARYLVAVDAAGTYKGSIFGFYTPQSGWSSHAVMSPDGKYLTYESGTAYNPVTPNIVVSDVSGVNIQTVGAGHHPEWSPFPATKSFVGTSGAMFTSAAGFLYTEQQGGFDSLVAFQATTPSSALATLQSPAGGSGPLLYDLSADNITSLKYSNGYFLNPVTLTPNVTNAIVTIDSTLGQVTAVAPFVAVRGASVAPIRSGSTITYKGRFLGVWNAQGKNLAPNGASTLVLDSKHGSIISAN